jgi:hypothetical protein
VLPSPLSSRSGPKWIFSNLLRTFPLHSFFTC